VYFSVSDCVKFNKFLLWTGASSSVKADSFSREAYVKPIRRKLCSRVGSVWWADCIRVLLGRFRSGHVAQSRTR
jgi:hypothetical protein